MANTNTNTSNDVSLSTDIYEIADFIDSVRRNNIPDLDETASIVGIFGWATEAFSQTLQNTLIVISETTNETIPTKAKFTKNVITHALNLGITKIMATPAIMTLMIYLPVEHVIANFTELDSTTGKGKFIFDKDVPIYIDKYEYHLDYDIIITRTKIPTAKDTDLERDKYVYTAMYDLFDNGTTNIRQNNPISNISNPYITTLVRYTIDNVDYLAFSVKVHQVSNVYITKNILTDNPIENKTITFEFEDQLAAFDVDVEENGVITHLTPIYSGLIDYTVTDKYCFYEYLNANTIRIIFDRDSYEPSMNATVTINVKLSEGASGNFTYNNNFKLSLQSEKYNNYNGMYMIIYPLLNGVSSGGKDKKSISDLKKIIPRESSSRGAVINTTDLVNYFNGINDTECKLYFYKKKDNPFERLYYSYMLMRKDSYVYPTNTISLKLMQDDFKGNSGNNNLSITPGTVFYYYDHGTDTNNDYASLYPPTYIRDSDYEYNMTVNSDGDKKRVFEYITPFLITIDDDLITSYLLTIMNDNKTFKFDDINTESNLQFVATNMNWSRKFIYKDKDGNDQIYDNKYIMDVSITQNNNIDYNLVSFHSDPDGNVIYDDIRVKMYMVLYADETDNNPYRYIEAELVNFSQIDYVYDFRFTMETDDLMDLSNRINIKNIKNTKPEEFQTISESEISHGYLNNNTYAKIYILADFGTKPGDVVNGSIVTEDNAEIILYGDDGIGNRTKLESILPLRNDIVLEFLKNNIGIEKDGKIIDVVYIMRSNPDYMKKVTDYNGNEEETESAILRYLRNNINSDFVQNTLLADEAVNEVIDSYNYEDISRFTLCNIFSINDGVDFYYDYSNIMSSVINVRQIQKTDNNGNPVYKEIKHTDSLGNEYKEYTPIYLTNDDGTYIYDYTVYRIPVIKNGFLNSEAKMEDFVYDLEERRKYLNECIDVLEDTFGIDLKFFNTFGPSKKFYYDIPSSTSYKAKVSIKELNVYSNTSDEDNPDYIIDTLSFGDIVLIESVKGIWGLITSSKRNESGEYIKGYIKLSSITRIKDYIDNVSLKMFYALETQTSSDKYIIENIKPDIKEYIEDINQITELHIPNIITLITNNYRDQLVYFEYLGLNEYSSLCQHIYLDETEDIEICPEFLNIRISEDGTDLPDINITAY